MLRKGVLYLRDLCGGCTALSLSERWQTYKDLKYFYKWTRVCPSSLTAGLQWRLVDPARVNVSTILTCSIYSTRLGLPKPTDPALIQQQAQRTQRDGFVLSRGLRSVPDSNTHWRYLHRTLGYRLLGFLDFASFCCKLTSLLFLICPFCWRSVLAMFLLFLQMLTA